ncbi:kin of IRRE-like protein 2 [Chelonus insularis]|uniref:kin of IRRE-like protein 2 n=1 Tax=Chelonus insularis TaxID=460826 RepID=UPI00158E928A|nr:kin of IRRE-like protein 2 [Chelonus insularis]XP_034935071.1 kin of IRRE-like protein 2 [Chelonus insularis]
MYLKKYEWVGSPDMGDCSLWVRSAALEFDDGLWQCQVTASDFTAQDALTSESARLVVRVSPQRPQIEYAGAVILPGGNVTARAGEIATLTCTARYGNPPPLIKWYLRDQEIRTLRPQVNATEIDNARTWSTKSVCDIEADRSRYGQVIRCEANHPAYPTLTSNIEVRFDVTYAPETRLVGVPIGQLEEGRDRVEIRCLANANPTASILWKRIKGADMEVVSIGEALIYSPIHRNHAATYVCLASNTEGESSPVSIQITVNYAPKIDSVGPDRLSTALLYSGASFECNADAMPPADYQWQQIFNDNRPPIDYGKGQRLILTNVTYEQQGQYICIASNTINGKTRQVKSTPVTLEVVGAPKIIKPLNNEKYVISTTETSPARLEIRLCSNPKPRLVAWEWGNSIRLHAGEVLESRYRALDLEPLPTLEDCFIAILELTSTVKEDQRLYYVIVENDRGSDRRALMLRVDDPDQIPLVIGAVAGFTVISVMVMAFICFLRSDKCCASQPTTLQPVDCNKSLNTVVVDDCLRNTADNSITEKRHNQILKPVPTQQQQQQQQQYLQQDCFQFNESHYQRQQHHYSHQQIHAPQYTLQTEQLFLKPDRLATLKHPSSSSSSNKKEKTPQYATFKPNMNR